MPSSSVTGVGQGSADKAGHRGSEHMFVGVEKLVGPRTMRAGAGLTAANVATITFPLALAGVTADYVVLVNNVTTTTSAQGIHVTAITSAAGQMTGFSVRSDESANVFHWAVIRTNTATVQVNN